MDLLYGRVLIYPLRLKNLYCWINLIAVVNCKWHTLMIKIINSALLKLQWRRLTHREDEDQAHQNHCCSSHDAQRKEVWISKQKSGYSGGELLISDWWLPARLWVLCCWWPATYSLKVRRRRRGADILTAIRPTYPPSRVNNSENRASLLSLSLLRDKHSSLSKNCWAQSKMHWPVYNIPQNRSGWEVCPCLLAPDKWNSYKHGMQLTIIMKCNN